MRLVYLSPLPWSSFAQRPHRFVEWFHMRTGGSVLWVDPYPTRLPRWEDLKSTSVNKGPVGGKAPGWLTVLHPRALPIEPLPASGVLNKWLWRDVLVAVSVFASHSDCLIGIGKPSELALQVLKGSPKAPSFFDVMDDFPAFYSGLSKHSMLKRERDLAKRVVRILVSSSRLLERYRSHGDKVCLVCNASSTDRLPEEKTSGHRGAKPILGYVGTIGHWFDWPLVLAMARKNPDVIIQIIGPVYVSPAAQLPHNIELSPACSHEDAILAMTKFSAGLIPFKQNELTESVDPIKYYEYRSLGLPVLTTRFGEMIYRCAEPGVFFLDCDTSLSAIAQVAMNYKDEVSEIAQFRVKNSWEYRFDSSGVLGMLPEINN